MILQPSSTTATKPMTAEEFDEWVLLPENIKSSYEFIAGEVREVVSRGLPALVAATILAKLHAYAEVNDLGDVRGMDGGFMVAGERYIPDVSFISFVRQPEVNDEGYNSLAPDFAVEVLSPSNGALEITTKTVNYLRAGTTVWIVDPDTEQIEIFSPNAAPRTVKSGEIADGGAALPDFKLDVASVFRRKKSKPSAPR